MLWAIVPQGGRTKTKVEHFNCYSLWLDQGQSVDGITLLPKGDWAPGKMAFGILDGWQTQEAIYLILESKHVNLAVKCVHKDRGHKATMLQCVNLPEPLLTLLQKFQ